MFSHQIDAFIYFITRISLLWLHAHYFTTICAPVITIYITLYFNSYYARRQCVLVYFDAIYIRFSVTAAMDDTTPTLSRHRKDGRRPPCADDFSRKHDSGFFLSAPASATAAACTTSRARMAALMSADVDYH